METNHSHRRALLEVPPDFQYNQFKNNSSKDEFMSSKEMDDWYKDFATKLKSRETKVKKLPRQL